MIRPVLLTAALAVAIMGGSNIARAQGEGPPDAFWSSSADLTASRLMPQPLSQKMPLAQRAPENSMRNMGAMMSAMQPDMTSASPRDRDRKLADALISHYESGINMARAAGRAAQDSEVRRLAQETIKAQEHEISHLRVILRRLGEG